MIDVAGESPFTQFMLMGFAKIQAGADYLSGMADATDIGALLTWSTLLMASGDPMTAMIAASTAGVQILFSGRSAGRGNQYTKSNLRLGQQMHKSYKANLHDPPSGLFKEYRGVEGVRPDFVDLNTRTIYELKPNNPRQISAGFKQLERYKAVFENKFGGTWKTILDRY